MRRRGYQKPKDRRIDDAMAYLLVLATRHRDDDLLARIVDVVHERLKKEWDDDEQEGRYVLQVEEVYEAFKRRRLATRVELRAALSKALAPLIGGPPDAESLDHLCIDANADTARAMIKGLGHAKGAREPQRSRRWAMSSAACVRVSVGTGSGVGGRHRRCRAGFGPRAAVQMAKNKRKAKAAKPRADVSEADLERLRARHEREPGRETLVRRRAAWARRWR